MLGNFIPSVVGHVLLISKTLSYPLREDGGGGEEAWYIIFFFTHTYFSIIVLLPRIFNLSY